MTVLSVDDARQHLRITDTSSDSQLEAVIEAAEARIGQEIGPLTVESKTVRVAGGGMFLLLPVVPAQSITSVVEATPDQTPVDVSTLVLDIPAGTVTFADGYSRFWRPAYVVTYEAGWGAVPGDVLFAIKEEVRHLWQTQRGSSGLPNSGADMSQVGFALPNRVIEMIAPYRYTVVG